MTTNKLLRWRKNYDYGGCHEPGTISNQLFEDDTIWIMQSTIRKELQKYSLPFLTPITVKAIAAALSPITGKQPTKRYVSLGELQKRPNSITSGCQAHNPDIQQPVQGLTSSFPISGSTSIMDLNYKPWIPFESTIRYEDQSPGLLLGSDGFIWSVPACHSQSQEPRVGSQLKILLSQAAWPEPVISKPLSRFNSHSPWSMPNPRDICSRKSLNQKIVRCQRLIAKSGSDCISKDFDLIPETEKLALMYYEKGIYKAATAHYAQVALARRKVLGPRHPNTVGTYLDVVDGMVQAGQYHSARKIHFTLHKAILKNFSPQDILSIRSMLLKADIYNFMRWIREAENIGREALQLSLNHLGISHQYTRKAMSSLSTTLEMKYKYRNHQEHSHAVSKQLLISCVQFDYELRDTSLQACRRQQQLALFFEQGGEYNQSVQLNQRLLRTCLEQYGSEHHVTLDTASQLGGALLKMRNYERCEPIMRLVILGTLKLHGAEYSAISYDLEKLAECSTGLCYWEEATDAYEEVYRYYEKDYDIAHERESSCAQRLRECYRQQGMYLNDTQFDERLCSIVKGGAERLQSSFWRRQRKWSSVKFDEEVDKYPQKKKRRLMSS